MSYKYLLDIALILLSTKLLGLVTRKFNLPQVVGALLAGVILGPAALNILNETDFISTMAEIGVIVLMFTAGLESDVRQLKSNWKESLLIASMGVLIPLIGGTIIAYIFNDGSLTTTSELLQNLFIGTILTATSVSITVEALRELGKITEKSASVIMGAAILDDILGIVVLTILTSMADESVNVSVVLIKIIAFFAFAFIIGYLIYIFFNKWVDKYNLDKRRFVIAAFVVCLLLAFSAEEFFGVADITGAFIAGVVLSRNKETEYIANRFSIMSYMLLSPIFFASIGINMTIPSLDKSIILLTIALVLMAMLSKIIGCGLSAKLCKYSKKESIQIGVGMMARGEVALIIANKGMKLGIMNTFFLPSIIIMVITTAILTPIFLKRVYK